MTPPEFQINPTLTSPRIDDAVTQILIHVSKYDNGVISYEDMAKMIRLKVTEAVNVTWDDAFTRGVRDAELDEDDEDDDEEIEFDFDDRED